MDAMRGVLFEDWVVECLCALMMKFRGCIATQMTKGLYVCLEPLN